MGPLCNYIPNLGFRSFLVTRCTLARGMYEAVRRLPGVNAGFGTSWTIMNPALFSRVPMASKGLRYGLHPFVMFPYLSSHWH